ncbi:putative ATPase/DNA-binding SARP family transcriptional activator [Actinomadura namibiensis]|uniref:Putative ATPase/DNA-binding SARP family transcriptional activator n=1 Tax=Actinomadura namibiensis TaxID=182080 RepID=A0A7W3QMZ2_ACTNM|nr:BTAD domain-containing putative transcriptional regulator [Actinomadura namibiensis]MBA8953065.1 putative ATPase/DNA-binding SARP family transcriptional activator [Actinomadura namibiensis]
MRIQVLGPVRACGDDGAPIDVGGARVRALLARLALAAGEVVPVESLVDGLWGDHPPRESGRALHALVYRLRRALGEAAAVELASGGYRLHVRADDVDAHRFERLAERGRGELAAGPGPQAAALLGDALALWRGDALADVLDAPFAGAVAARLEELRATATEDWFEAKLLLGGHGEILADLQAATAAHPLRERLAVLGMRALHASGRQFEALALFERVRRTLAEELGVDPSEELRRAHLTVVRGEPGLPERSRAAPGRLPTPLTGFVGRREELRLLAGLLEGSRLVTVVGPGGVGKTRLAVEAASRHRAHRRGRVWLVPLAGVDAPDGLPGAVLGTVTAAEAPPQGTPLDRSVALLAGDEGVLLLDNCEQISEAVAGFARRLLERLPNLTILATSREPLEVMGEALCRLAPLALPPAHADPVRAAEATAVRLFLDRAAAVRPGFALDESTVGPVVDIVRRLDGLPLALELAAARLRTMDAGELSRRLDDRFRLLGTGNRTARPRQRTLRAVIDWSWDLLTAEERALARRMSVFPARAGLGPIEAVCSDDSVGDVAYLLDSLVDKSIVERSGDGYRMLETIRAYAAGELRSAEERDAVRRRLTRHYADLAERHEPLLRSHRQAESLRLFGFEYDNLVHALQAAIDDGDADAAARILGPLYWYWDTLRYDGRADAYVARVLEYGDALPPAARSAFATIHLLAGGGDAERLRAAVEDCARTGALPRYPMLLTMTLTAASMAGLDDLVDREIARVRDGSDGWAVAHTHLVEALRSRVRGDWAGGATAAARALRAFEEAGDRYWTAMMLNGTAQIHAVEGRHDEAVADYGRSISISTGLAWQEEISSRLGLATERMRAGDPKGAWRELGTAERAAWDRGQPMLEIQVHTCAAELYRRRGEIDRADRELDRLERVARVLELPAETSRSLLLPARTANLLTAGDAARARRMLPGAVRAAQANMDLPLAAQLLARLRSLEGDAEGAATALGMSEVIRGAFDRGDLELGAFAATLADRLGRDGYAGAYRRGAAMPRQEAVDTLTGIAMESPN